MSTAANRQSRSRSKHVKKDPIVSSFALKRLRSDQAKDSVDSSARQTRSVSRLSEDNLTESSTGETRSISKPVKDDSIESHTGQKSSKSGQVNKDIIQSSTKQTRSISWLAEENLTESSTGRTRSIAKPAKDDSIESHTEQKRSKSGQVNNDRIQSSTGQKRSRSGLVTKDPIEPALYGTLEAFSKCVTERAPLIFDSKEPKDAYNEFKDWLKEPKVRESNRDPLEQINKWMNKTKGLILYGTLEAFSKCVAEHAPLIFDSKEPKDAYNEFKDWLKEPKVRESNRDPLDHIKKWMNKTKDLILYGTLEHFSTHVAKHYPTISKGEEPRNAYNSFKRWVDEVKVREPNRGLLDHINNWITRTAKELSLYGTLQIFSKSVAKDNPSIFERKEPKEAYDSFNRWLKWAKVKAPNHDPEEYINHWMKRKAEELKPPTYDSFEPAPYETREAFFKCVYKHYPMIFARLEKDTAYNTFMSWLEGAEVEVPGCDPREYIIHWMDLVVEDYEYAEGEEEKEGKKSQPRYKWARCQDPNCPQRSSEEPEQQHTHFYDPKGEPATETLMLYDVGVFTFSATMPADKDWADQLPHYPTNPTIRRKYAEWTEEDQRALLESKGLFRKHITDHGDSDEEDGNNEAMPNDFEKEGEVSEQEADTRGLHTATNGKTRKPRKPRNAPKPANASKAPEAPETPQPTTDSNAQTTDTAPPKKRGQKDSAPEIPRIVGDKLSQAEQDDFCQQYYNETLLPTMPKKRGGKQFVFRRLPDGIPDKPYTRKTDYFNYLSKEPEEDMDTRAKFNLPLSAKQYAKYYEEYKRAREQKKVLPYDRNWMQRAGIPEGAAASEGTSLCGVSGIKSEDFEQDGVIVRGDILYIRYNEAIPSNEEASSEKRTKSSRKSVPPVTATSVQGSAPKKLYTSQETYTHEITGRVIAYGKNKQVYLHVNGFLDVNDDPLVVPCTGPKMIYEYFRNLAPGIDYSRPDPYWHMVEVRSQTGEEFGSIYRVRQHYELFKAEMDEWAENAGVQWRTTVDKSVKKKEDLRLKRAEGVKNGEFVKKGKGKQKNSETKEKEEAKAKKKEEAKAKREAKAKEKKGKAQQATSQGQEATSQGQEATTKGQEATSKGKGKASGVSTVPGPKKTRKATKSYEDDQAAAEQAAAEQAAAQLVEDDIE